MTAPQPTHRGKRIPLDRATVERQIAEWRVVLRGTVDAAKVTRIRRLIEYREEHLARIDRLNRGRKCVSTKS